MGKCGVGSACRDSLKTWASAVFLFAVMTFMWAAAIKTFLVSFQMNEHSFNLIVPFCYFIAHKAQTVEHAFTHALTCDTDWRILQPSAQSPSPVEPPSPATSAAEWLRLHPSPMQSHNDTLTSKISASVTTTQNMQADSLGHFTRLFRYLWTA